MPVRLQPAPARVLRQGGPDRGGLYLRLKLGDQPAVTLGFPVHGVLQPLDETLEVCHARFQRAESIRLRIGSRGDGTRLVGSADRFIRLATCPLTGGDEPTDLAHPGQQPLTLTQRHRPRVRFGSAGRGG